jgi:hypothetical protein
MATKAISTMRRLRYCFALLLTVASAPLHANWGSTAGGSVATGSFHAFGTAQIEMQREDLHIRLFRDRAKVEIDYVFHNTGPAVDVRAGFPSLGVQLEDVKHREIENYTITADDQPVSFRTESGDPAPFKHLYDAKFREMGELDDYPPEKRPELLEWFASSVHFEAGQSRRVHIRYDSLYAYCGGGYSDDGDDCDDRFAYVLSTAAAWKGPIGSGSITIEPVTVSASRLILSPAGRFLRKGSEFVWSFRNLKPTRADDIVVNLNNHFSTIAVYGESPDPDAQNLSFYTAEGGKYFYLHSHFVPHGDAASPEYSASQVVSSIPDTAWHTPHTPGIGDALSLEITKPDHIDQVGIIPGCGSKEQDWFGSARIKAIEVVVNNKYTRRALLPDEFTFPWPESHKAYEWIDLPPYPGRPESIRLVIRSVYPGTADQVTCIGKVVLRQWLKTRPAVKSGIDGHELP